MPLRTEYHLLHQLRNVRARFRTLCPAYSDFFLGAGAGRAGAGLSILDQGSDQVIAARQQLALLMTGLPGAFTGRDL